MPRGDFATDTDFRHAVEALLQALLDQVDAIDTDLIDPSLTPGTLTIRFEDGAVFLLSQQTPTHELWLSAERKAWHFVREGGRWIERDSAEALATVLGGLMGQRLGAPVLLRA